MSESFLYSNADIIGISPARYFTATNDDWKKQGWGVLEIKKGKNIWYDLEGNISPPEPDDCYYEIDEALYNVVIGEWKEVADRFGSEL